MSKTTKDLRTANMAARETRSDKERSRLAEVAHGFTFAAWLAEAGRTDSASEHDLRAAWRAGESPADYR